MHIDRNIGSNLLITFHGLDVYSVTLAAQISSRNGRIIMITDV